MTMTTGTGRGRARRFRAIVLVAAVMLALVLAGCAAMGPVVQEPRINLIDIRLLDARLLEQRYQMTFRVINPNDIDIPIQAIAVDIELEAIPFASGVSNTPVTLPAYGEAEVDLIVSANLIRTAAQLADFLKGRPAALHYRLNGHLKVDLPMIGRLPVSAEGALRLMPDTAPPNAP